MMADSQGGAVTDLEAKFKVLERCLVGGRFLLQEMDHMLRIANESSMLEFASVGDFCRLFKEALPLRNVKDIGEMYANMLRESLIEDNRFVASGQHAPLKLLLAPEPGSAPHVKTVQRPPFEQINSPKRAVRPVAPFEAVESARKPKKRTRSRADLGDKRVEDMCNVEGCSDFSLCNAHEGAPPNWPHETAKYLEALLFEWNGEVNAIPMTSPVGIFDKIEIYKVNDKIGLGVRAKGPPDQIVFEKGAYVGTYCGVLMNDLLLWGCDKGHYLQMVASEVPHISVNAKGYGNYTRLFNHSRDSKNMDALVSSEKLEHPAGNFKFSPTEYWTCRDVYGGEQLCFDYGPDYFPHLDMVPLTQTPQRRPEAEAALAVMSAPRQVSVAVKQKASSVHDALLAGDVEPRKQRSAFPSPVAVASPGVPESTSAPPPAKREREKWSPDLSDDESSGEGVISDLEEGEWVPEKRPAAPSPAPGPQEVFAVAADGGGITARPEKKIPEKKAQPRADNASAANAAVGGEPVLWDGGAIKVLDWGTSNFNIDRVGGRDPYLFRAGLICIFSVKGVTLRVHCIAEDRWLISQIGSDKVPKERSTMRHALKDLGLDTKGNESQTLKQKLQTQLQKRFGSGEATKKTAVKTPSEKKAAAPSKSKSESSIVKTTASKQASAGPQPLSKQIPAKKSTAALPSMNREIPLKKAFIPSQHSESAAVPPLPTPAAVLNAKLPELQVKSTNVSQFKVPAKRPREEASAQDASGVAAAPVTIVGDEELVVEMDVDVGVAPGAEVLSLDVPPVHVAQEDIPTQVKSGGESGEGEFKMMVLPGRKRTLPDKASDSGEEPSKKLDVFDADEENHDSDDFQFDLPE